MTKQLEFRRSDLRTLSNYESKLLTALANLYAGKWDSNPALKVKIKALLMKQWAKKIGVVPFNGFKTLIEKRQKRNTSAVIKIGNKSVKFTWLIVGYDRQSLEQYALTGKKPVNKVQCNVAPEQPSLPNVTVNKQQFDIELFAVADEDGKPRTRRNQRLRHYQRVSNRVYITNITDKSAVVKIKKVGDDKFTSFEIKKHKTQNYYLGLVNGSKVRVVLLITKAKFTYWAIEKADLIK